MKKKSYIPALLAMGFAVGFAATAYAASASDHAAHHPNSAAVATTVALPAVYSSQDDNNLANRLASMGVSYSATGRIAQAVEYVRSYVLKAITASDKRVDGDEISQNEADLQAAASLHAELQARQLVFSLLGEELGKKVNEALFGSGVRNGSLGNLALMANNGVSPDPQTSVDTVAASISEQPITDLTGLDIQVSADTSAKSDTMYDQMMKMMRDMQPQMKDMMGGSVSETPKATEIVQLPSVTDLNLDNGSMGADSGASPVGQADAGIVAAPKAGQPKALVTSEADRTSGWSIDEVMKKLDNVSAQIDELRNNLSQISNLQGGVRK